MTSELSPQQKLFEELKQIINGVECWDARVLMPHVGYNKWQDFENAIERAMQSARTSGETVENQFLRTSVKTSPAGGRPGANYLLTRRACYLVFQNGDPKVPGIAAAQAYFVKQTIRQEAQDQRAIDWERISAHRELRANEGEFTRTLLQHDVKTGEVGLIRSNGDKIQFGGNNTATMKKILKVPEGRILADFLGAVAMNAKSLAASMTTLNTKKNNLYGFKAIDSEHKENSIYVRNSLELRDIRLEELPAETDMKQVYIRTGLSKGPRKAIADGQQSLL